MNRMEFHTRRIRIKGTAPGKNLKFKSSQLAGNVPKISILLTQKCTFLVILWTTVYENQTVMAP